MTETDSMTIGVLGQSLPPVATPAILSTTSMPAVTVPNTA